MSQKLKSAQSEVQSIIHTRSGREQTEPSFPIKTCPYQVIMGQCRKGESRAGLDQRPPGVCPPKTDRQLFKIKHHAMRHHH
jgi:hypothetical protein